MFEEEFEIIKEYRKYHELFLYIKIMQQYIITTKNLYLVSYDCIIHRIMHSI